MILQIAAIVFILAIAFFQVVQGIFSALVMTVLSVFAAIVAMNYYEPLAEVLVAPQPGHAHGAALIALFVLTLLPLRFAADYFLSGNVVFGVWADRIGGGVLGLLTGMICIGILTTAMQMLPFGSSILMYQPFDDTLQRQSSLAPFYPDEFTTGLFSLVSQGSLSGEHSFGQVHQNLLRENHGFRNTGGIGAPNGAPQDSVRVVSAHTFPNDAGGWRKELPLRSALWEESELRMAQVLVLRVQVSQDARGTSQELDKWFRLPATQFQVITRQGRRLYPVAYLTHGRIRESRDLHRAESFSAYYSQGSAGGVTAVTPPLSEGSVKYPQFGQLSVQRPWFSEGGPKWLTIDWVYYLPKDDKALTLVFRRTAQAEIPALSSGNMPGRTNGQLPLLRWIEAN